MEVIDIKDNKPEFNLGIFTASMPKDNSSGAKGNAIVHDAFDENLLFEKNNWITNLTMGWGEPRSYLKKKQLDNQPNHGMRGAKVSFKKPTC